ncbi:MAG TPA: Bax inhibitor-1 family protein, partial [Mucilaginibacter sp.]|nr:Bax inhibitor-1 family protein [Mucilaginibacter sp.]
MENQNPDYTYQNVIQIDDATASRKFMAGVFAWMFVALGISAAFAYEFSTPEFLRFLVDPATNQPSGLFYLAMFSPLAFVLIMSFGINKLSYGALSVLYVLYSAVTGISFSIILLAYTASSVLGVFLTASLIFGVMAVAGYTTKTDLT